MLPSNQPIPLDLSILREQSTGEAGFETIAVGTEHPAQQINKDHLELLQKIQQFPSKQFLKFFLEDFSDVKKVSACWLSIASGRSCKFCSSRCNAGTCI